MIVPGGQLLCNGIPFLGQSCFFTSLPASLKRSLLLRFLSFRLIGHGVSPAVFFYVTGCAYLFGAPTWTAVSLVVFGSNFCIKIIGTKMSNAPMNGKTDILFVFFFVPLPIFSFEVV